MTDQAPTPAPATSPDRAPSDPVGTGIGNASSIFDLVSKVIDKATGAWEQGSASREIRREADSVLQELKDGLGEWEAEAKAEKHRWRQPFLGTDAYEKHFFKNDGVLSRPGRPRHHLAGHSYCSLSTFGQRQVSSRGEPCLEELNPKRRERCLWV
jgi:hypothetical protein